MNGISDTTGSSTSSLMANNNNDVALNKKTQRSSLELEPTIPPSSSQQQQSHWKDFCQSLWSLLVAYAMYYRGISTVLFVVGFILVIVLSFDIMVGTIHRAASHKVHHLEHDYSNLPLSAVELQMARMDHWCLRGGDNNCRCTDPTEPLSREHTRGWLSQFERHKQQGTSSSPTSTSTMLSYNNNWDVVLLGDDVVEDFEGTMVGKVMPALKPIAKYWNETFGGGGDVDGLAFGIRGDTISNLLWRMQHGEVGAADSKVYWIHIGTHDIGRDECSEEAVLLGILRLVEWLHEQRPYAVIVINSILPRYRTNDKNAAMVWTAIQEVNAQLQAFCVHHEHLVYFDATPLFVNSNLKNKRTSNGNNNNLLRYPLYEQDQFHLSVQGHKVWGNAILERLKLILYDDDESSK